MWPVSPEIFGPDADTELATMTPRYSGKGPSGGAELPPGRLTQPVPQAGTAGAAAKPLNCAGAVPPLRLFACHQMSPQNSTCPVALWSPTTNVPPPGANAYAYAVPVAAASTCWSTASVTVTVTG